MAHSTLREVGKREFLCLTIPLCCHFRHLALPPPSTPSHRQHASTWPPAYTFVLPSLRHAPLSGAAASPRQPPLPSTMHPTMHQLCRPLVLQILCLPPLSYTTILIHHCRHCPLLPLLSAATVVHCCCCPPLPWSSAVAAIITTPLSLQSLATCSHFS